MRKLLYIFLLFSSSLPAQNLVPNPSFEQYTSCPSNQNQINYAIGWMKFAITPDYFHACSTHPGFSIPYNWLGYQQAATGNAYAGLYTKELPNMNLREYIGIKLTSTLITGKTYNISFKANSSLNPAPPLKPNCATNNLGVLFTTYPFYWDGTTANYPLYVKNFAHIFSNQIITDTLGWTTIADTVIADSAYIYIVIGNFFVDSLTSHIKYFDNGYSECVSYYFIDDIYVGEVLTSVNEMGNNEMINIYYSENNISIEFQQDFLRNIFQLKIYDLLGRKIFSQTLQDKKSTINISNLLNGMYIVQIESPDKTYTQKIIK